MPSRKDDGLDATAPCCTRPAIDPWEETMPNGRRVTHYPPGPTGGEVRSFRDQDTGEYHYMDCVRNGVDGSQNADKTRATLPTAVRPFPTASYLNLDHTAAYLEKAVHDLCVDALSRIGRQDRLEPDLLDRDSG